MKRKTVWKSQLNLIKNHSCKNNKKIFNKIQIMIKNLKQIKKSKIQKKPLKLQLKNWERHKLI